MLSKVQDDVFKRLVLSTTKRYSVNCHGGGKKPEDIHPESENCYLSFIKINDKLLQL